MSTLFDIVTHPSNRLRASTDKVPEVNSALQTIMDLMLETMYQNDGIGLAAPQVGIGMSMLVMDISGERAQPYYMVNPVISEQSDEFYIGMEGCLSVKDGRGNLVYHPVRRPFRCKVNYLDYYGEERELVCDELLAKCVQHEVDHLNGVLFFDHLRNKDRKQFMKLMEKGSVK